MGLDITVEGGDDQFSFRAGSYSGFDEWRKWLASIAGIELDKMMGFGGSIQWKKDTPFRELLHHSDCDGTLGVRDCKKLKEDFDMFFFSGMSKSPDNMTRDDAWWVLDRYYAWHKAVTFVAEGKCRRIRFG
jgi:hypothetical protein